MSATKPAAPAIRKVLPDALGLLTIVLAHLTPAVGQKVVDALLKVYERRDTLELPTRARELASLAVDALSTWERVE